MNIGELAQRCGISAKAIRYHERIGVLSPPPRSPSGYRVFGEEAVERLAFVRWRRRSA